MGYYVSSNPNFEIKKENVTACTEAIQEFVRKDPCHYDPRPIRDLCEGLYIWGYELEAQPDGNWVCWQFNQSNWRNDEDMFEVIAPYIEDGGTIHCQGEEGDQWRFTFKSGKLIYEEAMVIYQRQWILFLPILWERIKFFLQRDLKSFIMLPKQS